MMKKYHFIFQNAGVGDGTKMHGHSLGRRVCIHHFLSCLHTPFSVI